MDNRIYHRSVSFDLCKAGRGHTVFNFKIRIFKYLTFKSLLRIYIFTLKTPWASHLNSGQFSSSKLFKQSLAPSHTNALSMQRPCWPWHSNCVSVSHWPTVQLDVSSDASPQSFSVSQRHDNGMHVPLAHLNWLDASQFTWGQLSSSLKSRQSRRPLQRFSWAMHVPLRHLNWSLGQKLAVFVFEGNFSFKKFYRESK